MADKFAKFTEHARHALTLANEEAARFKHSYIGTEHILLGLLREQEGVAAQVLMSLGIESYKVRSAVEFIIGRGDRMVMGEIGLTPRAKKVIELAVDEARRLNHHYIGTEHLLLGLVREGEGIAAGVLESLGVSLDKVRAQVIHVLSQSSSYTQHEARQATPTTPGAPSGYSPGARRAFALAQAEAGRLGHSYLGTGHLLLGLLADREGAAARALTGLGLVLKAARAALARATWPADEAETPVGLTTRLERVLVLAAAEARRRGAGAVDAGHLLWGLVAERDNVAVAV